MTAGLGYVDGPPQGKATNGLLLAGGAALQWVAQAASRPTSGRPERCGVPSAEQQAAGRRAAGKDQKNKAPQALREKISPKERELIQQVVADERFGKLRDGHLHALSEHGVAVPTEEELESNPLLFNPQKVLTTWGSECVRLCLELWDVENAMKEHEHMKHQVAKLERERTEAHRAFMQEVQVLKTKIGILEKKYTIGDIDVTDDDLCFYEPLKYLPDTLRDMVRDVIIHKVKTEMDRYADHDALDQREAERTKQLMEEVAKVKEVNYELTERLADAVAELRAQAMQRDLQDAAAAAAAWRANQQGGARPGGPGPTPAGRGPLGPQRRSIGGAGGGLLGEPGDDGPEAAALRRRRGGISGFGGEASRLNAGMRTSEVWSSPDGQGMLCVRCGGALELRPSTPAAEGMRGLASGGNQPDAASRGPSDHLLLPRRSVSARPSDALSDAMATPSGRPGSSSGDALSNDMKRKRALRDIVAQLAEAKGVCRDLDRFADKSKQVREDLKAAKDRIKALESRLGEFPDLDHGPELVSIGTLTDPVPLSGGAPGAGPFRLSTAGLTPFNPAASTRLSTSSIRGLPSPAGGGAAAVLAGAGAASNAHRASTATHRSSGAAPTGAFGSAQPSPTGSITSATSGRAGFAGAAGAGSEPAGAAAGGGGGGGGAAEEEDESDDEFNLWSPGTSTPPSSANSAREAAAAPPAAAPAGRVSFVGEPPTGAAGGVEGGGAAAAAAGGARVAGSTRAGSAARRRGAAAMGSKASVADIDSAGAATAAKAIRRPGAGRGEPAAARGGAADREPGAAAAGAGARSRASTTSNGPGGGAARALAGAGARSAPPAALRKPSKSKSGVSAAASVAELGAKVGAALDESAKAVKRLRRASVALLQMEAPSGQEAAAHQEAAHEIDSAADQLEANLSDVRIIADTISEEAARVSELQEQVIALKERNSVVEIALKEMHHKLGELKAQLEEVGMASAVDGIFSKVGLSALIEETESSAKQTTVFSRLYEDAIARERRRFTTSDAKTEFAAVAMALRRTLARQAQASPPGSPPARRQSSQAAAAGAAGAAAAGAGAAAAGAAGADAGADAGATGADPDAPAADDLGSFGEPEADGEAPEDLLLAASATLMSLEDIQALLEASGLPLPVCGVCGSQVKLTGEPVAHHFHDVVRHVMQRAATEQALASPSSPTTGHELRSALRSSASEPRLPAARPRVVLQEEGEVMAPVASSASVAPASAPVPPAAARRLRKAFTIGSFRDSDGDQEDPLALRGTRVGAVQQRRSTAEAQAGTSPESPGRQPQWRPRPLSPQHHQQSPKEGQGAFSFLATLAAGTAPSAATTAPTSTAPGAGPPLQLPPPAASAAAGQPAATSAAAVAAAAAAQSPGAVQRYLLPASPREQQQQSRLAQPRKSALRRTVTSVGEGLRVEREVLITNTVKAIKGDREVSGDALKALKGERDVVREVGNDVLRALPEVVGTSAAGLHRSSTGLATVQDSAEPSLPLAPLPLAGPGPLESLRSRPHPMAMEYPKPEVRRDKPAKASLGGSPDADRAATPSPTTALPPTVAVAAPPSAGGAAAPATAGGHGGPPWHEEAARGHLILGPAGQRVRWVPDSHLYVGRAAEALPPPGSAAASHLRSSESAPALMGSKEDRGPLPPLEGAAVGPSRERLRTPGDGSRPGNGRSGGPIVLRAGDTASYDTLPAVGRPFPAANEWQKHRQAAERLQAAATPPPRLGIRGKPCEAHLGEKG